MSASSAKSTRIPLPYRLFFLYIEPVFTLLGAVYAYFTPTTYLFLTHAPSSPTTLSPLPIATHVVLRQLANLYLAFVLNEALVLRCTSDLTVWRTLLFGLLVADFGHLWSCAPLAGNDWGYFWDVAGWNSMAWGNIGFVYCGATMRTCFLLGVGLGTGVEVTNAAEREIEGVKRQIDSVGRKGKGS